MNKRDLLILEIYGLMQEYSKDNWGGDDESPIDFMSVFYATLIVHSLPKKIIMPGVSVDNTGYVCLDWNEGKDMILSTTINNKCVEYAAIVNSERYWGDSKNPGILPLEVKYLLSKYFTTNE